MKSSEPTFTSVYRLSGEQLRLHDAGKRIPRAALRTRAWEAVYEALNADADFCRELATLYGRMRPSLLRVELRTNDDVVGFAGRWQLSVQDVLDAVLLSHMSESTDNSANPRLCAPMVVHAGAPPPQELSLSFTYDLSQETPKQARSRLASVVREAVQRMDALERAADMVTVPPREGWVDLRIAAGRWVLHLKGLTVSQIASREHVSEDAVKSGLRRWRHRLGVARPSRGSSGRRDALSRAR